MFLLPLYQIFPVETGFIIIHRVSPTDWYEWSAVYVAIHYAQHKLPLQLQLGRHFGCTGDSQAQRTEREHTN